MMEQSQKYAEFDGVSIPLRPLLELSDIVLAQQLPDMLRWVARWGGIPLAAQHVTVTEEPHQEAEPNPAAPTATASERPLWWVAIEAELEQIGYSAGWTAECDLWLVEAFANGTPIEATCDALGVDAKTARARFITLTPNCVNSRGARSVTPDRSNKLIHVLRARAAAMGVK